MTNIMEIKNYKIRGIIRYLRHCVY